MKRVLALWLGCLGSIWTAPALADASAAAAAERAYQEVDFPGTHELAERALESGGGARAQTARLYVLLGTSAAALGNADEARQDFIAALAIEPDLKLEKSLSPKIRDPYLAAQGYWGASSERLTLTAKPSGDANHLVVRLSDPAGLVAKVELRVGRLDAVPGAAQFLPAAAVTRLSLPAALRGRDYEFALRAVDRYGNALAEYGAEADPIVVRASLPPPALGLPADSVARGRSYFLPVTLAVAGVAAAATGVVFHIERERAAEHWNGPRCETPGRTRVQQCSSIDSQVQNDERLAVGFYAAGGALLTGSLIALLAGRDSAEPQTLKAGSLACVWSGPGMSCAGRF